MKILFINPKYPVFLRVPSIPLGLVSIASYLQAYGGHEVAIVERSVEKSDIKTELSSFQPDIVGISAISYSSSKDAIKVSKYIHEKYKNVPVVYGGPAATASPELYLKSCGADFIILGEGEITWKEFVDEWSADRDFKNISGLAFLKNDKLICNPMRPVADLYTFPEMNWSLVKPKNYFSSFFHCTKMLYLHASKGCPGHCTFCPNEYFHQGKTRTRNPIHIMHDIEYFVKKCGANGIYFSDEQFIASRAIRNQLLDLIIDSKLDFVWGCQMRLGVLKPEDLDKMYKAGCRWILFGIESGCQETIDIIKKGTDLKFAKPTIDYCSKLGITVQASFIIGFPHETEENVKKTVRLAKELSATLPVLQILTILPGSEIYEENCGINPKFKIPRSLSDLVRIERTMLDSTRNNISNVPNLDLKVLHFYFLWISFSSKDSVSDDSFGVIKKLARDTFNRIFKHGISGFFFGTYSSIKQFATVFFYSHFFPSVLKKYDLK